MDEITIQELITLNKIKLKELQLSNDSIVSYHYSAFQPISDFYTKKNETFYRTELMDELDNHYQKLFSFGNIPRKTFRWRQRGIGILNELYDTGSFDWKVFIPPEESLLSHYYREILTGFLSSLGNISRIGIYRSITERYFLFLTKNEYPTIYEISSSDISDFIVDMCPIVRKVWMM